MNKSQIKNMIEKAAASNGIECVRMNLAIQRAALRARYKGRFDDAFHAHVRLSLAVVVSNKDKSEKGRAVSESRAIGW